MPASCSTDGLQLILALGLMGSRGEGGNRPTCDQDGCGRWAYVETKDELLCHVCDSAFRNQWAQKMVSGSPARQRSTPLQDFLDNPALAKMCMEFVHGDGWELQCHCTRCKPPWLDAGWVCYAFDVCKMHLGEHDEHEAILARCAPSIE